LDEIKKKVDAGKEVNWEELDDHLVTGTVKLFLRELPQPLLTFDLYPEFVAVNGTFLNAYWRQFLTFLAVRQRRRGRSSQSHH